VSDLIKEDDHVGVALGKLLHQFKNSTDLKNFFSALLSPLQTTEDDLMDLYSLRWPDSAVGLNLDTLGAIVGQPREGRTDSVYRLWIQARILINRSTGKADDSLKLLQLITDSGAEFHIYDQPPAGYLVEIWNQTANIPAIFELLIEAKPAGVKIHLTYSGVALSGLFRYDSVGQGFDGSAVYAGDLNGE